MTSEFPTCQSCVFCVSKKISFPAKMMALIGLPTTNFFICGYPMNTFSYEYEATDHGHIHSISDRNKDGMRYVEEITIENPEKFFCSNHKDINGKRFINWGEK